MIDVIGVSLNGGILEYFSVEDKINRNTYVIVDSDKGLQFGQVVFPNFKMDKNNVGIKNKFVRIATKKDNQKNINILNESEEALKYCKSLVIDFKLNMNILSCMYNFDKSQLLFKFTSETRVDFRELAKKLANFYKTRIELRQIGVRDKAKEIGGYGSCGQKLCCARFNSEFASVSINMAKNQNISLNPSKINGVCGRLLCCLKYEDDNYKECRKSLPKINSIVKTDKGEGKVIGLDILNGKYRVIVKNEIIEMSV